MLLVVHDLAYRDIVYDGWEKTPSIMRVPGARRIGVQNTHAVEGY